MSPFIEHLLWIGTAAVVQSLHGIYAAVAAGVTLGAIRSRRLGDSSQAAPQASERTRDAGSGKVRCAYSFVSDAFVDR
jgi:hypothetical protein